MDADQSGTTVIGPSHSVAAWQRKTQAHQKRWLGTRVPAEAIDPKYPHRLKRPPEGDRYPGVNFLDRVICREVQTRIDKPEKHELIDLDRLWGNLLSSMPMCFNLFGHLATDQALAQQVVAAWFPDLHIEDASVEVNFEWSPGRRNPEYLADKSAFDVSFHILGANRKHLIGIETKYHERPKTESLKDGSRYREVGQQAGHPSEAISTLRKHRATQIWRDHLLALSCLQHPTAGWDAVKCVLVAPAGNPAWKPLADEYCALIPNATETFKFRTIEDLLDAVPGVLPQEKHFRERYLDVEV